MAKIKIAELEIDDKALIKSTSDVKKAIDELKAAQKDLANQGDTNSKEFVKNASDLKVLGSAYAGNMKALAGMTQATVDATNKNELMALALGKEVTSIAEARDQNKILNKLRNETNVSTAEGKTQLEALNKKLDQNNNFVKENADAYLQQKINIGNYSDSMKEALNSMNPFNGGLTGFIQRSQEAGGVMPLLQNGLKGVITGVWGLIKASIAFIATPIGAVITAIAAVFAILYSVLRTFTPVLDKIEQGFAAVSAVLNVIKTTIVSVMTGVKDLGSVFSGLGGEMKKAAAEAVAFTKAQQDLDDALEKQEITSARNRAEIDKLNTLAKDRTKTDAERIALLKKAEEIETKDYNQRLKNAKEEERITLQKIKSAAKLSDAEYAQLVKSGYDYKETTEGKGMAADELFTKLKENQVKLAGLDQQYNVNLEKGINKQNKLIEDAEKEREKAIEAEKAANEKAIEAYNKRVDAKINGLKQELSLLEEQNRFNTDTIGKQKMFAAESIEILKAELAAKKISQTEYQTSVLKINNDLEATEIARLKTFNDKKNALQNELDLQNTVGQDEREALKLTQDLEKHLAELENINLKETEKAELKKLILEQYNLDVDAMADKAATERARKQSEFDIQEIGFEKTKAETKIAYAQQVGNILTSLLGNSLGAQLAAIAFDAVIQIAKLKIATSAAQQINMAAATAVSIPTLGASLVAATASNIALGVSSKAQQAAIMISAGISGLGAVAKKFEKGGIQEIGGKSHSQGGTKFYGEDGTTFEAQSGEGIGILNRSAYAGFMDFNNSFNGGQSGNGKFAGGGIITQGVRPNGDNLAQAIQDMNLFVAVEDINRGQGSYAKVIEGANS